MHLEKIQDRVSNLELDLCDGVKLIKLLEVLHGSPVEGRYYKNPKSRPYKIDNVNFALSFIRDSFHVKLIGCSAEGLFPPSPFAPSFPFCPRRRRKKKLFSLLFLTLMATIVFSLCCTHLLVADIVDGNLKIILGMLWRLIQKFHFSTDSVSRQSLLAWCRKITEKFQDKIPIDNFQKRFPNPLS